MANELRNALGPAEELVKLVRFYEGCSLDTRCDELGELIARGVDDPNEIVKVKTNCGMFALGIWKAMGVPHELLERPYENQKAISWIVTIAHDFGAVRYPVRNGPPRVGSLMHYWLRGEGAITKNHHVEFCLSEPGVDKLAVHGGGGRTRNAITIGQSDIGWAGSTPLQAWYDLDDLLDGVN